jgi:Tfp pilus assembly protein PilN
MREIDFLPDWYPQIQQRYRHLIAQACVTIALIVLLAGYAMLKRSQVQNARAITAHCETQITVSQQQLAQLNKELKYHAQLRQQEDIVARLGIGVETTRLLKSLEDVMTPEMSLTDVSLETIESPRPVVQTAMVDVDRQLKVVVDGVAPNDTQLAMLLENLSKVKCFENVAFTYFREGRSRDGHMLREFEFTFDMNLNPPMEVKH